MGSIRRAGKNLLAAAFLAVLLLAAAVPASASEAAHTGPPAAAGETLPAAGPWAGVEALWRHLAGLTRSAPRVSDTSGITGGGLGGGDAGQGLDPDGGTGDPGGTEEPPPPDDGTTTGGGTGGAL